MMKMNNKEHEKRMSELNSRIEIANAQAAKYNAQAAKYNAQAEKDLKIAEGLQWACGGINIGFIVD